MIIPGDHIGLVEGDCVTAIIPNLEGYGKVGRVVLVDDNQSHPVLAEFEGQHEWYKHSELALSDGEVMGYGVMKYV